MWQYLFTFLSANMISKASPKPTFGGFQVCMTLDSINQVVLEDIILEKKL